MWKNVIDFIFCWHIIRMLSVTSNKYMPPNDLATEIATGEHELETEEEMEARILLEEEDEYTNDYD